MWPSIWPCISSSSPASPKSGRLLLFPLLSWLLLHLAASAPRPPPLPPPCPSPPPPILILCLRLLLVLVLVLVLVLLIFSLLLIFTSGSTPRQQLPWLILLSISALFFPPSTPWTAKKVVAGPTHIALTPGSAHHRRQSPVYDDAEAASSRWPLGASPGGPIAAFCGAGPRLATSVQSVALARLSPVGGCLGRDGEPRDHVHPSLARRLCLPRV
ncbi:hypothetical protein CDD80_6699 [Ophiocordyceps camponoti-rufipedis]|uniref:Uncharacterized protein n=1 Tax=Ophiocordyceps camponoti-rufipedis TaxID=2004952 RepID=A0A2C5YP32_9HYPO|nr:hypothetical protein CDD80_6699 [Ophiocordyceps camponoti-rufipedis]